MEELLTTFYENSTAPVLSAFVLGLLTAVSPCPLATNITAVGYISRDLQNKKRVFYNGLVYTAGRAAAYTLLAVVLFFGADQLRISSFFQQYGEKMIGPLLVVAGIVMLGIVKISFPGFSRLSGRMENRKQWTWGNVFLLGILFALAFCPYSGVLYFGMLIPLTISSAQGLLLPVVFAVATGIPVILFAWLIAFAISGVGRFYNVLLSVDFWMRKIIGLLFIGVGIYYIVIIYF